MRLKKSKTTYRKNKRQKYRYVPFAIAMMAVVLTFGISVFLKVKTIEICGEEKYTKEEILAAAEAKIGDSLMVLDKASVAAKIKEELPYIDIVKVKKQWPTTLIITVSESIPAAAVEKESGGYYKIDKNGRILEEVEDIQDGQLIKLKGLTAVDSDIGSKFKVQKDSQLSAEYALNVLKTLAELKQESFAKWISVADAGNIKFAYKDNFVVELGSGEDIEDKLEIAIRISETVEQGKTGRIIVKNKEAASFVPNGNQTEE